MAKICGICGKRPLVGNQVSHSARKTLRRFNPNLQSFTIMEKGVARRVRACTSCIRTYTRKATG